MPGWRPILLASADEFRLPCVFKSRRDPAYPAFLTGKETGILLTP